MTTRKIKVQVEHNVIRLTIPYVRGEGRTIPLLPPNFQVEKQETRWFKVINETKDGRVIRNDRALFDREGREIKRGVAICH